MSQSWQLTCSNCLVANISCERRNGSTGHSCIFCAARKKKCVVPDHSLSKTLDAITNANVNMEKKLLTMTKLVKKKRQRPGGPGSSCRAQWISGHCNRKGGAEPLPQRDPGGA